MNGFMKLECFESDGIMVKNGCGELTYAPHPVTVADLGFEDDHPFESLHGWWARYSAPGYLDATDWCFSSNSPMEAIEEAFTTYGDDEDDAEVAEYESMMDAARKAFVIKNAGQPRAEEP